MTIDVTTLRWARPENLERLARALRVSLPDRARFHDEELWQRRAARSIAAAIDLDAWIEAQRAGKVA